MLFNSAQFLIFFPIVTLAYFILPVRVKNLWLLAASYFFYMCWNPVYALLILFSTAVTFTSGLAMDRIRRTVPDEHRRILLMKLTVAASFVINLGILAWFKYTNFALSLVQKAFAIIHLQIAVPVFDIVLPVGISFYTFQALSYTMDVYRGDIYAEKNFFRYALFVSFFPQLVAGPIERSKNLLKQLAVPHRFNFEEARNGLLLMLWGFFLKLVIADRVAIVVNTVYGDINSYGGWYMVLASVLFAVQIYCDFMGYSTIAMGASEILGIHLMENFDAPYLSTSVAQFWRRWHISLTSWFRDYLYIPLGGSRRGKWRKYFNILVVFFVSGLWHGASLSFVAWGVLNGLYQVIGDLLKPVKKKLYPRIGLHENTFSHKVMQGIITFILVDFTWIFFRAGALKTTWSALCAIVLVHNPWVLVDGSLLTVGMRLPFSIMMYLCIGILLLADIFKRRGLCIRKAVARQDGWFQVLFIVFAALFILQFGVWGPLYSDASFIYFQF